MADNSNDHTIYNCHTHIFNIQHVPVNFLEFPLKLLALLVNEKSENLLRKFRQNRLADMIHRYYKFKEIGEIGTQAAIFDFLDGYYPADTKFVVLMMDMEFMGAGKVPASFESQLTDLKDLKQKKPDKVFPFVFAHPEREGIAGIVKQAINEFGFAGIKIYPALGYFPNDPRLDEVYKFAEEHQVPIITHCSRGGVYFKGKLTKERRTAPGETTPFPTAKNHEFTDIYSDPDRYVPLLEKYKKLKLCFGHFGGEGEWLKYLQDPWNPNSPLPLRNEKSWYSKVRDLIYRYDNVYADISYNCYRPEHIQLLKVTLVDQVLRERILFGSDYYMLEMDTGERSYGVGIRGELGEELFWQIAEENPRMFLVEAK